MSGTPTGLRYVVRRLFLAALTFIGATLLVFLFSLLAPGDPVDRLVDEQRAVHLDAEQRRELRVALEHEYGLDRPAAVRYLDWLRNLTRLRLGRSLVDHKPVATKLAQRIPYTLALNAVAISLIVAVSVPLGVALALRRGGRLDRASGALLDLSYAAPYFWTALLLQYVLAVRLGWLPVGGPGALDAADRSAWADWIGRARHLVLPAGMLAYGSLAYIVRFVRAAVIDSLDQPFVVAARSRGMSARWLFRRVIARHAAVALIPLAGAILARLLAGSVLLETIFSWPGIGQLFSEAVRARDYQVIQALGALSALSVIVAGLLADLALALADPRVSFGGARR